jgi:hypothetical protein
MNEFMIALCSNNEQSGFAGKANRIPLCCQYRKTLSDLSLCSKWHFSNFRHGQRLTVAEFEHFFIFFL